MRRTIAANLQDCLLSFQGQYIVHSVDVREPWQRERVWMVNIMSGRDRGSRGTAWQREGVMVDGMSGRRRSVWYMVLVVEMVVCRRAGEAWSVPRYTIYHHTLHACPAFLPPFLPPIRSTGGRNVVSRRAGEWSVPRYRAHPIPVIHQRISGSNQTVHERHIIRKVKETH